MNNLDIEKYNKAFEKTLSFLNGKEKISLYNKINRTIQSHIELNRVSVLSFPFEKVVYQSVKVRKNYRYSYMRYHGIFFSNDKYYIFDVSSKRLLSSSDLVELIKIRKHPFKKSAVEESISLFNGIILSNILKELKESVFLFNEEESIFQKELHYFFKKNVAPFFNKKKTRTVFFGSLKQKLSPLERKLAYKLSGKSLAFSNDIISLFKENDEKDVVELLEKYPLLFPLFAKEVTLQEHEQKRVDDFIEKRDKSVSLVESVKKYFSLTDLEMETIKKTSWQKLPVLKNRTIVFIDLIKKGLRTEKIRTRKEAYSAYMFYYYLDCNNRFYFSNVDYNIIKDLSITKDLINNIKEIYERIKSNERQYRLFINASFIKKIHIEDPYRFILKIRQLNNACSFLKDSFKFKNKEFKLIKQSGCLLDSVYSVNNEIYKIKIKNCSSTFIDCSIRKETKLETIDLSDELKNLINLEYSKLFNKRYKTLSILNRESLLPFIITWFEKTKKDSFYYFCVNYLDQDLENYHKKKDRNYNFKDYYKYLVDKELVDDVVLLDII